MTADAQTPAPSTNVKGSGLMGCGVIIIGASIVLGLFFALVGVLRINLNTIEGEKVGQVYGLHKQGFLSKTWEAELIRGGMDNGSGGFGMKPFDFTIPDDTLADKVRVYSEGRVEVIVTYRQSHIYAYWNSENSGIYLTSIRPAKQ